MVISVIDKVLNIEELTATANLKIGGKTEIKTGNIQVNQVFVGTVSPNNPDLIAERVQELISNPQVQNEDTRQDAFLVLSPYLGVIKSKELKGTRVQLEFTVTNNLERPIVLKGVLLRLNKGEVNFNKFFKVREDAGREPDFMTRFPIVLNSKGATRLSVEFENLEQPLIKKGSLKGELLVLIDRTRVATQEFIFEVNDAMVNTLNLMQQQAELSGSPVAFDAMIKS